MRKGPLTQETDQDSEEEEEEEDGEEDDEEPPRRKWQGIEAIFEAYQEHIEGTKGREEQNEGPVKKVTKSLIDPSVQDVTASIRDSF